MLDSSTGVLDAREVQSELLAMLQRNASQLEFNEMLARVEANTGDSTGNALLAGSIRAAVAVREQQALQQRRERGLLVVLETAQDLTAIRDLELVLQAIVRRARQIFASDIGYLTNHDRVRDDFYIRATDGAISDRFKNVRVPLNHGICGQVFQSKTPYHSSTYLSDHGFNHDQGIDLAVTDEGVHSLLGAPLLVGNQCIGVLCICDRQSRTYEPWEVSMLATLAAQASIAIENARLFQEAQVALQQASAANELLYRQAQETEAAADAHERMTKLVARGGAVADILSMVSSTLQGHVGLLDEAEQLVHKVSPHPQDDAQPLVSLLARTNVQDRLHRALSESRLSGGSRLAVSEGDVHLRVAALIGAERLLGAMVILTRSDLTETQVRIFERGALVAGVVLLSRERSELAVSSETAAIIRALVGWRQENPQALQSRVEAYGIDVSGPLRLMLLDVGARNIEYALRRARSAVLPRALLMEEYEGMAVAICQERDFQALCSVVSRTLRDDPRLEFVGVTSATITRADDLPRSHAALKRGVEIMKVLGRKRELVEEAVLSMYALVFEQRQSGDMAAFIDATAGPLLVHDERKKSALGETMLAYFESGQNAKATAQMLGIHVNTLRQRLESVDALLGSWRQGGRALELQMALSLLRLRSRLDA